MNAASSLTLSSVFGHFDSRIENLTVLTVFSLMLYNKSKSASIESIRACCSSIVFETFSVFDVIFNII